MKYSFHSLNPFLQLFCNCQIRTLDSIHFLCSWQAGISKLNLTPHSMLLKSKTKSKLCYERWSVGQSVLVSSTYLGLKTRFFLSDSCRFVDVGHPFWRDDGSVFYNVKYTVKPALNGPFIKRKFVLNENIFRSCDFGAHKNVKYSGLNGNCLTRKRKSK
jgi:hypothetical protein